MTGIISMGFSGSGLSEGQEEINYAYSFGSIPDKTVYHDVAGTVGNKHLVGLKSNYSVDLAEQFNRVVTESFTKQFGLKSTNVTSGAGGGITDQILFPIWQDQSILDISHRQTPIQYLMRSVTEKSLIAVAKRLTSKPTASFELEGASLNDSDFGVDQVTAAMKYLYVKGKITGQAEVAMPGYTLMGAQPTNASDARTPFGNINASGAMPLHVITAAEAMREKEEEVLINGDSSVNPKEFDGIIKLLGTTNNIDKSGTAFDVVDINEVARRIYENGGYANFAFCDTKTFQALSNKINDKVQFIDFKEKVEFGFPNITFKNGLSESIVLTPSRFLSTADGNQSMYVLDMKTWEKRVLQDITYKKLPDQDDTQLFMLKKYFTCICRAVEFNGSITGMTN